MIGSLSDSPPSPRPLRWVGAFTVAYLAIAIPTARARGNSEFIFYILVMFVIMAGVWAIHRRINLTYGALWGLSLWGLAHMLGGLMPVPEGWPVNGDIRVLYSLWLFPGRLKYDQVVHAYGFGMTTWVCWQGLRAAMTPVGSAPIKPTFGLLLIAATAGMGFGAMNEVVEFVATLTVPETNVGGYINTGWDLVSNMTGCLIAAALIYLLERRKRTAARSLAG